MKREIHKRSFGKLFAGIVCGVFALLFGLIPALETSSSVAMTAKAETATVATATTDDTSEPISKKSDISDANFRFEKGAAVYIGGNHIGAAYGPDANLRMLRFNLVLENEDLMRFVDNTWDQVSGIFTLYREESDRMMPIYKLMYFYVGGVYGWAHKHVAGDEGVLSYHGDVSIAQKQDVGSLVAYNKESIFSPGDGVFTSILSGESDFNAFFADKGYTLDFISRRAKPEEIESEKEYYFGMPAIFEIRNSEPFLDLIMTVNETDCQYFVDFEYEYKDFKKTKKYGNIFNRKTKRVYDTISGNIASDTRSIFTVLNNMLEDTSYEPNALEYYLPSDLVQTAYNIIAIGKGYKKVTISYHEQIGDDSPFARKVTAEITVPIHNDVVTHDAAAKQLGKDNLNVMTTKVNYFKYNATKDIYEAVYFKDIELIIRTKDGNTEVSEEMGLNINQSFEEYFSDAIDHGILPTYVYEKFFADICDKYAEKYPELNTILPSELYGYWAYAMTPQTKNWNDLWGDIFGKESDYVGIIDHYEMTTAISGKKYRKLLKSYKYEWYYKIWEAIAGGLETHEVRHYMMLADPLYSQVGHTENGGGLNDSSGLMLNDMEKAAAKVADEMADILQKVGKVGSGIMKFFGVLLGGLTIVAAVAIGVKGWNIITKGKQTATANGASSPAKSTPKKTSTPKSKKKTTKKK